MPNYLEAIQRELTERVLERTTGTPYDVGLYSTSIERLTLLRIDTLTAPSHTLYTPAMCVNLQGTKQLILEDESIEYRQMQYALVGVDVPLVGRMLPTPGRPFLGLSLEFDLGILREMVEQLGVGEDEPSRPHRGFAVGELDLCLLECFLRIVRLLDTPEAIPTLYPHISRELYYWSLRLPHGASIAKIALKAGSARPIVEAIQSIRSDLARPIRVEKLADLAGMSPSSFYAHFRAVTSMSPVQYQKRLRLMEARRLMRSGVANATEAAFAVGYASVSQFSREYARMFGAPPLKDIREVAGMDRRV